MKKSTPLLLLSIFSAACMAFSLAACGGNSGSGPITSLDGWNEVLDSSNYTNFSASVKSTYTNNYKYVDASTSVNNTSTTAIEIEGTAKYGFTSGTYLAGAYNSYVTMQYKSDSNSYTQNIDTYKILSETAEQNAAQTTTDGVAGNWSASSNTAAEGSYTPYTTDYLQGYAISGVPGVYLYGDEINICSISDSAAVLSVNDLLKAEYSGLDVETYYPDSTAAEYKDGAYVCRYGEYPLDDEMSMILNYSDSSDYKQYCDCYVKVSDGRISSVKLEYTYYLYREMSGVTSERSITRTIEWSFYDYGTTGVTVPDEVNALFK